MKTDMKYDEAVKELETLVARIEDPDRDFSGIADDVKKAAELVKWCKAYIRGEEKAIDDIISQVE